MKEVEKAFIIKSIMRNLLAKTSDVLPENSDDLEFFIEIERNILKSTTSEEARKAFQKVLKCKNADVKEFLNWHINNVRNG